MTPLEKVYAAFLSKMEEDEWTGWDMVDIEQDWRELLDGAIAWFKFPRVDLTIEEDSFVGDLDVREVQILGTRMKCEWLNRSILTWQNIKPAYEEKDFSVANFVDKLQKLLDSEISRAEKLESIYYRSIKNKPFDYSKLAGTQ